VRIPGGERRNGVYLVPSLFIKKGERSRLLLPFNLLLFRQRRRKQITRKKKREKSNASRLFSGGKKKILPKTLLLGPIRQEGRGATPKERERASLMSDKSHYIKKKSVAALTTREEVTRGGEKRQRASHYFVRERFILLLGNQRKKRGGRGRKEEKKKKKGTLLTLLPREKKPSSNPSGGETQPGKRSASLFSGRRPSNTPASLKWKVNQKEEKDALLNSILDCPAREGRGKRGWGAHADQICAQFQKRRGKESLSLLSFKTEKGRKGEGPDTLDPFPVLIKEGKETSRKKRKLRLLLSRAGRRGKKKFASDQLGSVTRRREKEKNRVWGEGSHYHCSA